MIYANISKVKFKELTMSENIDKARNELFQLMQLRDDIEDSIIKYSISYDKKAIMLLKGMIVHLERIEKLLYMPFHKKEKSYAE